MSESNTEKIEVSTKVEDIPVKKNIVVKKKHGPFMRFLVWLAKQIMKILWPTKVYFKERFITEGRAVVICNHYSKVDSDPILGKLFGEHTNVMFKSELTKHKIIAEFLDALGGISVHRGESDMHAIKKVLKCLKNDEQVLLFPEGTRNMAATKEMLPFKEGAAMFALMTKSPIVPLMYYDYPGPFKKNYLIVGEPFTLEQFYDMPSKTARIEATAYIRKQMESLRVEIDCLVEVCKGNKKKYIEYKQGTDNK